jgi:PTS system cellobiose-specific IIC component
VNTFEKFLNKYLAPIANKMNANTFFSTLAGAFMRTLPVTIGVSVILIIYGLPIPAWQQYIYGSDLNNQFNAAINASMNALGIYVAFNFAYLYANHYKMSGLNAGLLSLVGFLMLMPQVIKTGKTQTVSGFLTNNTGGGGLIVAILVGYITAKLFVVLTQHHLTIKMPQGVPPMVEESMSPAIIGIVILTAMFAIRMIFYITPYHDVFTLISKLVQMPLQNLTGNVWSVIVLATLTNVFWFFGLHPSLILGIASPILMSLLTENINALAAQKPLPYLAAGIVYVMTSNIFGGQGQTYGLVIAMARAKSARYKQLFKLEALPALFNVNEPLIFGFPIMLNPIFFLPMLLVAPVSGFATWGMIKLLGITKYLASAQLPWTTPGPMQIFILGGWQLLLVMVVVLVLNFFLWYPFFKIADRRAVQEEQAARADV